jgi:hypothetical protein
MHKQRAVKFVGVVANGGGQPEARAKLARCILNALGATMIPVGVGSFGKEYASMPHEYGIEGYDAADAHGASGQSLRLERGDELIARVLSSSPSASLTVVCISSLRDFADAIRADPLLVRDRVCRVGIQGGIDPSAEAAHGYAPDTSVNNEFDRDAAGFVYDWCFGQGVPMSVVSRHAVPMLPMQLARSFAERTACPVMRYLAGAQFLGLAGLWQKLCEGKLPARCDKAWYFETFCGVNAVEFAAQHLEQLGAAELIIPRLNGFVKPCVARRGAAAPPRRAPRSLERAVPRARDAKPRRGTHAHALNARCAAPSVSLPRGAAFVRRRYDVVALLAALPATRSLFDVEAASVTVRAADGSECEHLLLLRAELTVDVEHVQRLLRETYHEVVLATSDARAGRAGSGGASVMHASKEGQPAVQRSRAHGRSKSPPPPPPPPPEHDGASASGARGQSPPRHSGSVVAVSADARSQRGSLTGGSQNGMQRGSLAGGSSQHGSRAGLSQRGTRRGSLTCGGQLGAQLASRPVSAAHDSSAHAGAAVASGVEIVERLRGDGGDARGGARKRSFDAAMPSGARAGEVMATRGADGLLSFEASTAMILYARAQTLRLELRFARVVAALVALALVAVALVGLWSAVVVLRAGAAADAPAQHLTQLACSIVSYPLGLACVGALRPIDSEHAGRSALFAMLCTLLAAVGLITFALLDWPALGAPRAVGGAAGGDARCELGWRGARASLSLAMALGHTLLALALLPSWWRSSADSAAALRALWRVCGGTLALQCARVLVTILATGCAEGGGGGGVANTVTRLLLLQVVELALLVGFVAWPGSLARVQLVFAHLASRASAFGGRAARLIAAPSALVPLVGHGSTSADKQVTQVAEDARASLCVVQASPATLELVSFEPSARARISKVARRKSAIAAGAAVVPIAPAERALPSVEVAREASSGPPSASPPCGAFHSRAAESLQPSISLSSMLARPASRLAVLDAAAPDAFDFYVVHAWADPPELKGAALREWSERYTRDAGGRQPTIWLDALCADATRSEAEQLAQMPFLMGRARGLLLLCGPGTLDCLRCAVELYVWLATGGKLEHVQVAVLGAPPAPAACAQIVAAFDVFHAMYVKPDAAGSDPAIVEKLTRAVELAHVSLFNEAVRSYLPRVREQCALVRARHKAAGGGSLESESDEHDAGAGSGARRRIGASLLNAVSDTISSTFARATMRPSTANSGRLSHLSRAQNSMRPSSGVHAAVPEQQETEHAGAPEP